MADRMGGNYSLHAKGVCQRCDFKYDLHQLRREWTGLRVCSECWDPRPIENRPPSIRPEGQVKPGASPELEPVFLDGPITDTSTL